MKSTCKYVQDFRLNNIYKHGFLGEDLIIYNMNIYCVLGCIYLYIFAIVRLSVCYMCYYDNMKLDIYH